MSSSRLSLPGKRLANSLAFAESIVRTARLRLHSFGECLLSFSQLRLQLSHLVFVAFGVSLQRL